MSYSTIQLKQVAKCIYSVYTYMAGGATCTCTLSSKYITK